MNISSVKYQENLDDPSVNDYYVAVISDALTTVPMIQDNRHYRMIQEWVAEGNTVAPMYTQEELDAQQASQDEREALEESIRNKLKALGLTTKEMGLLGIPEEECN